MKNYLTQSLTARLFMIILFAVGTVSVFAAPPSPPNLEVMTWQGNSSPLVESPYQYTSRVKNIGNQTATGVTTTVEFPLTNTSPTRYILGKLTGIQASGGTCSVVSNKIVCNFGNIGQNQTKYVRFNFEFQVATTAQTLISTVSTTSGNEFNPANNTRSLSPTLTYPDNIVSSGTFLVSSCTGRSLTSYYECEISSGSVQTGLSLDLNLGGTLIVTGYPNYFGFWDQNTMPNKSLHFTIDGGTGTEVEFNGFATSGACFEGITAFPQSPNYNAAYRVCRQ